MLLGFVGFTARGVSFCEVVSRLTLTTKADPAPRALKFGVPSVVIGASRQPANRTTAAAPAARNEMCVMRCSREELEGLNRRVILSACNLTPARRLGGSASTWRLADSFLSSVSHASFRVYADRDAGRAHSHGPRGCPRCAGAAPAPPRPVCTQRA